MRMAHKLSSPRMLITYGDNSAKSVSYDTRPKGNAPPASSYNGSMRGSSTNAPIGTRMFHSDGSKNKGLNNENGVSEGYAVSVPFAV